MSESERPTKQDPVDRKLNSAMRMERAWLLLERQPAFKPYASNFQSVCSRTGRTFMVPATVIRIVNALAEKGIDAHKCPVEQILQEVKHLNVYDFTDRH